MEKFDIIVIGAGPAGSAAAIAAASGGLSVLLTERGRAPGDKNLFGGRIYDHALKRLGIKLDDLPYERYVNREMLALMDETHCTVLDFFDCSGARGCSFVARRSKFDSWLASKAEEAGAILVPSTRVESLSLKDGKVTGIRAGGETIECSCVIDAEGVTATLARQAGVRRDVLPSDVKIGVKETVQLDGNKINERFNLKEDEGAAFVAIGYPSRYMTAGGGFIYTNKDSLSIGLVLDAEEVSSKKIEVQSLIEDFRQHPYIQRLVSGGQIIEYSAHMIPSFHPAPEDLIADGFMVAGDAGGFFINHGYTYRGVDMAIASGMCAGKAAMEAHSAGDFSKKSLSAYTRELSSEIFPELAASDRTYKLLHNPRLFSLYPPSVSCLLSSLYTIDGFGEKGVKSAFEKCMRGKISMFALARDLYSLYRNM
ncbi:MAG: FAD-dependent oxidoreductase [Methanomassiliicoccales archaeon]